MQQVSWLLDRPRATPSQRGFYRSKWLICRRRPQLQWRGPRRNLTDFPLSPARKTPMNRGIGAGLQAAQLSVVRVADFSFGTAPAPCGQAAWGGRQRGAAAARLLAYGMSLYCREFDQIEATCKTLSRLLGAGVRPGGVMSLVRSSSILGGLVAVIAMLGASAAHARPAGAAEHIFAPAGQHDDGVTSHPSPQPGARKAKPTRRRRKEKPKPRKPGSKPGKPDNAVRRMLSGRYPNHSTAAPRESVELRKLRVVDRELFPPAKAPQGVPWALAFKLPQA